MLNKENDNYVSMYNLNTNCITYKDTLELFNKLDNSSSCYDSHCSVFISKIINNLNY